MTKATACVFKGGPLDDAENVISVKFIELTNGYYVLSEETRQISDGKDMRVAHVYHWVSTAGQ